MNEQNSRIKYPFWLGSSASAMAACVTHPVDLAKVRSQAQAYHRPVGIVTTVTNVIRNEGIMALYCGLSASILRQLIYSTVRFGIYEEVKIRSGANPPNHLLIATAWVSGFAGGIAGNCADVLNVRMQNDGTLPPEKRRNYLHVGNGMVRMAQEEGFGSYFRGWVPNCMRAATQTAGQLASYDIIKEFMMRHLQVRDTSAVQSSSAFLAALLATTVTNPIDVIKTRIMSSTAGTRPAMLAVAGDAFRQEGLGLIFRGWVPSFLRIGP